MGDRCSGFSHQLPPVRLASFASSSWYPTPPPAPDSSPSPQEEFRGRRCPVPSQTRRLVGTVGVGVTAYAAFACPPLARVPSLTC